MDELSKDGKHQDKNNIIKDVQQIINILGLKKPDVEEEKSTEDSVVPIVENDVKIDEEGKNW